MRQRGAPRGALASLIRDLPAGCRGAVHAFDDGLNLAVVPKATELSATPGVSSRGSAGGWRAVAAATHGRIGLDIETLARVACNTTATDPWLARAERTCVRAAPDPVLELACRWTLKEAYGKALGLGLALPLDKLAFGGRGGMIVAEGPDVTDGWTFALYRWIDLLVALARHPVQAGTPFAPIGRKPPIALLDM